MPFCTLLADADAQEERVGFDNQLSAIERTLKAKVHDHEELETMCHDAAHARDVARAELANFRKFVEEQRGQRLEELEERKAILNTRLDATRRISDRVGPPFSLKCALGGGGFPRMCARDCEVGS